MAEWRTIDSAPDDGMVLLYFPPCGATGEAARMTIDEVGGWNWKPTHWMELPAPPEDHV